MLPSPENKAVKLRDQISSFNDEIKQAVIQVNHLHQERDKLLSETGALMDESRQLHQDILRKKDNLLQLITQINEEKQFSEKNFREFKELVEGEKSKRQAELQNLEKELDARVMEYRRMVESKNRAEAEEKGAITKLVIVQRELKVEQDKLDRAKQEFIKLKENFESVGMKYEALSLEQSDLLRAIKEREKLLHKIITGIDEKNQVASRLQTLIFSSEKTLQARNQELAQANKVYKETLDETDALREICKKELADLKKQKTEFNEYRNKEQEKIKQGLITISGNEQHYQKKERDLRIVTARLKRAWSIHNKDKPFPAI